MTRIDLLTVLNTIRDCNTPIGATYLSEKLSVPSATIGRMLKDAEDQGYLEKVGKKGRIITEKGSSYLKELELAAQKKQVADELIDSTGKFSVKYLLEILQIRLLIEPYVAGVACQKASDDEITALETLSLEQIIDVKKGGIGYKEDLEIHLMLARISGNETIHRFLKLLLTENNVYTSFSSISSRLRMQNTVQHTEIIQALKDRNPDEASAAMKTHIERLITYTKQFQSE